jgi:hypothetical protein
MSDGGDLDPARLELAEAFLREAVYRSRAAQAAASVLPGAVPPPAGGRCGLGERAVVVLDLSDKGRELFERIWSEEPTEGEFARLRDVMREWIVDQDALDRKRNHFLKAFRNKHGPDRTRYSSADLAEYEAGLTRINSEEDEARRAAARTMLATAR